MAGEVVAGANLKRVSGAVDLFETLADLAGIEPESTYPLDGWSFADDLRGRFKSHGPSRTLFSSWRKRHTARSQRFRLDHEGSLFNIENDRGQLNECSADFPEEKEKLESALAIYRKKMAEAVASTPERPFTVGYSTSTTLPARDGQIPETAKAIKRSSKAPNNSFFENWTDEADSITWNIETAESGEFEVIVYYTCRPEDVGVSVGLAFSPGNTTRNASTTRATVNEAFDPPLYDKAQERVPSSQSHYYVKDFKPLSLGTLRLDAGKGVLTLGNARIAGTEAIDVHSIELIRK